MEPEAIIARLQNIIACCRILQENIECRILQENIERDPRYKHVQVDIESIKKKLLKLMVDIQNGGDDTAELPFGSMLIGSSNPFKSSRGLDIFKPVF
jgi:hypothetical protein